MQSGHNWFSREQQRQQRQQQTNNHQPSDQLTQWYTQPSTTPQARPSNSLNNHYGANSQYTSLADFRHIYLISKPPQKHTPGKGQQTIMWLDTCLDANSGVMLIFAWINTLVLQNIKTQGVQSPYDGNVPSHISIHLAMLGAVCGLLPTPELLALMEEETQFTGPWRCSQCLFPWTNVCFVDLGSRASMICKECQTNLFKALVLNPVGPIPPVVMCKCALHLHRDGDQCLQCMIKILANPKSGVRFDTMICTDNCTPVDKYGHRPRAKPDYLRVAHVCNGWGLADCPRPINLIDRPLPLEAQPNHQLFASRNSSPCLSSYRMRNVLVASMHPAVSLLHSRLVPSRATSKKSLEKFWVVF